MEQVRDMISEMPQQYVEADLDMITALMKTVVGAIFTKNKVQH